MTTKRICGVFIIIFLNVYSLSLIDVKNYLNEDHNLSHKKSNSLAVKWSGAKIERKERLPLPAYTGNEEYLIDTPTCYIPNYLKTIRFNEGKYNSSNCGKRAVFISWMSRNSIKFTINTERLKQYDKKVKAVKCCYQFARRSRAQDVKERKIIYSRCIELKNGTVTKLRSFIVTVACYKTIDSTGKMAYVYSDAYLMYLRNKMITETTKERRQNDGHWNVLMVGIDSMSRGRAYKYLPETTKFLKDKKWINYRGYNKVGLKTFPNIMAVMSGKDFQNKKSCHGIPKCNQNLMWSHYKRAGYTTAYGEEYIHKSLDSFGQKYGFDEEPTDYYVRPFFVTGQRTEGNIQCAGHQSSVKQLLNYAADFTTAYKRGKFFAYFWFSGVGQDSYHRPRLHDKDLAYFLKRVSANQAMNNTFVFFYSDHGVIFDYNITNSDGFYESRLPMMFIHAPYRFREIYKDKYDNIMLNENRLTTPFDFHATLWDILKLSNSSVEVIPPNGCPKCTSFFNEIPLFRFCEVAGVNEKLCSCQGLSMSKSNDHNDDDDDDFDVYDDNGK